MKNLLLSAFLCISFAGSLSAQKFFTQSGKIAFYSSSQLEDIEAINNQVSSVINGENGEMAFTLLMKAFVFEKALMQEHFNEKYVESDKFPKASFKGKIEGFNLKDLKDSPKEYTIKGTLTIHGVSKEISVQGTLQTGKDGTIKGSSEFKIELSDYDIEIPSTVEDNISNTIKITIKMEYEKMG